MQPPPPLPGFYPAGLFLICFHASPACFVPDFFPTAYADTARLGYDLSEGLCCLVMGANVGWCFSWLFVQRGLFSVVGGHDRAESTVSFINEWSTLYDSDASVGSDGEARRYAPIYLFSILVKNEQSPVAHSSHAPRAWPHCIRHHLICQEFVFKALRFSCCNVTCTRCVGHPLDHLLSMGSH